MYFLNKLFFATSLSLSLFLTSADLNGTPKPRLIEIGKVTTTGGPNYSAQSFRSGGFGPAGYEGVLNNKGSVTNNNSFGGEVNGLTEGTVTHGFIRDQLHALEKDDGDIWIVRSKLDMQWQDAEGNQYDFEGFGFFKSHVSGVIKFFTTGSIEDKDMYWSYGGYFYTNNPELEKYSHHTAVVKISREAVIDAQGNFIAEGKLYLVEDSVDTWDDVLAPAD